MRGMISINKPYTDKIFDHIKKVEWRKGPLPEGLYYVYETKNKGGCGKIIGEMSIVGNKAVDTSGCLEVPLINIGCVHPIKLKEYAKDGIIYANFIENAKRYETPKELGEFMVSADRTTDYPPLVKLRRPPQSWCRIEEVLT